jgi:hypothetical protein
MATKKRGGLVKSSKLMEGRTMSARHLRRKAEKLGKRYPTEVNHVLQTLEGKHEKR